MIARVQKRRIVRGNLGGQSKEQIGSKDESARQVAASVLRGDQGIPARAFRVP